MCARCMGVNQKPKMATIFKAVTTLWMAIQSTSNSKTYYIPDMQINVEMRYILRFSTKICKVKYEGTVK